MENEIKVSDTKNRWGRPNAFPGEYMKQMGMLYHDVKHRSIVHKAYMCQAMRAIKKSTNKTDYVWLFDEEKAMAGGNGSIKFSILTELGRVLQTYGEDHFWKWCKVLCREKPKTHDAVASIRSWRIEED
jgi:hypothetical protein